jgi:predicted MFS family arabinose efflux permease
MESGEAGRSVGYVELLRTNADFRRLWIGRVISQAGDWFNSVALFTLLLRLTGTAEAIGSVLIIKLLPTFFIGPLAGVVADRFNRKTIMIATDLLRGLVVLSFLFIDRPEQVWMVYALTAAEVVLSTFFEPAQSAAVPSIVTREALVTANALSGATWSATLALGAAAGGFVTDQLGTNAAFMIDSASFFLSAAYIAAVRLPSSRRRARDKTKRISVAEATGAADFIEGARYLRANPRVMAFLLVKSGWGLGGGVLLLLTIFGKQIFPIGRDGSTSIGLLYAARGFGALIGPLIARRITSNSLPTMRRAITVAFFLSALFYVLFARSSVFALALLCVVGAHAGGSIQWVFSTTLLQMAVPDRFLGRVFALELAFVMLAMSASTYATGWAIDDLGVSARTMAMVLGLAFIIPGLAWLAIQRWIDKDEAGERGALRPLIEPEPVTETSFPPGD